MAHSESIYRGYDVLDHLGMSLSVLDEEQLNIITDFFNEHPSGLGKREIWRSLQGQVSRNTIDKIIAYLIKTGSMRVEPDEDSRRQGQKGRYILIESNARARASY